MREVLALSPHIHRRGLQVCPLRVATDNVWVLLRQSSDKVTFLAVTKDVTVYVSGEDCATFSWVGAPLLKLKRKMQRLKLSK